ncbi:MAG: ElyC/SanA/YdcF family protein [Terriglobales bacterium]
MRFLRWLLLSLVLLLLLGLTAGRWLVVEEVHPADVLVVLGGNNDVGTQRGLELLRQGLAPDLMLDASSVDRSYIWTEVELAQQFIRTLPPEVASRVSVCATPAQSTLQEAHEIVPCLERLHAHSVLLVAHEFHTRRALSIFRHELPGYRFGSVATHNPREFGTRWWQHRQWAKECFLEWQRLSWWETVDRWRKR